MTSTRSRKTLTFDDVREIGQKLPDTEEGTAWGTPVLRVNGNIFVAIPIHKSAEPGSLSVHCDFATRDAMIGEQPDVYYTAAHYENYPCVLVRLARIDRGILEDLVRMSHRSVSSKPRNRRRVTKTRRSMKTTRR